MNLEQSYLQKRLSTIIPVAILLLGIVLRLIVFFDNRCLWTDEVAVALNVFEKSYTQLALPLDYAQYAPPLFLWIVKACTQLFGYSEQAFRLYPLLAGIAALFVFHNILRRNLTLNSYWYPLLLFATGLVYLRYTTELKQYMPDALITLLLIWLALSIDLLSTRTVRFILIWCIAGSLAIWSSMPSVFVLASVGCYYGIQCLQHNSYKKLWPIATITTIWLIQFLYYYHTILSVQIHSDYLVSYHNRFFLFALPSSSQEWLHNKDVIKNVLQVAFGDGQWEFTLSTGLLFIGIVVSIVKRKTTSLLYILPILLMLLAAALKQYSLIPRLTLFAMPLLLLLAGIGLEQLLKPKRQFFYIPIFILIVTAVVSSNPLNVLSHPIREEQMATALDYIAEHDINSKALFVYTGAANAYRYYTSIHPNKTKWTALSNGYILTESTNYDSVFAKVPDKVALLYSIVFDSYVTRQKFEEQFLLTNTYQHQGCEVFIFQKRQ